MGHVGNSTDYTTLEWFGEFTLIYLCSWILTMSRRHDVLASYQGRHHLLGHLAGQAVRPA